MFQYVEILALGLTLLLVWLFATNIVLAIKSLCSEKPVNKKFLMSSCIAFTLLFLFNILTSIIMAASLDESVIGLFSVTVFSAWASMTIASITLTVAALRDRGRKDDKKEKEETAEVAEEGLTA